MTDTSNPGTRGEQEMQDQLRILSGKFLLRTRDQAAQLRQLLQGLATGREPLTTFEEIAHKIHGSGAMFGFAQISACGGDIESLAETALAGQSPLDAGTLTQLGLLIEQLDRLVQAALAARS